MENHPSHSEESQEISLRLEHYDDIFSDFDIRPYSKRALSVDFIDEIRRASGDKKHGNIDLVLYIPEKERTHSHEPVIQERLEGHFKRHYQLLAKEKSRVLGVGISMVLLGVVCMIAATFLVYEDPGHSLVTSFLVVFLEPAAWFLLWEGMDQVIFNSKNINPELSFYKKMHHSHGRIHFKSY